MARLCQTTGKKEKFTRTVKGTTGVKRSVRDRNRCPRCGRARGYLRKFMLCRICFRQLALSGDIPGVVKSSW